MSRAYLVVTPEYGTVIPILDDGTGPMEYGCDTLVVCAKNARRAKVAAVRTWRRKWRHDGWLQQQLSDGASPFVGLKVLPYDPHAEDNDVAEDDA